MLLKLKEKPCWLQTASISPKHGKQHEQSPQKNLVQATSESSSTTSTSYYNNPTNREELFLPLPNHSLTFIDERERSNPNRFKRYKCMLCKRNTHHRCLTCNKAFCKECAFKKHISMNPMYAKDNYSYE